MSADPEPSRSRREAGPAGEVATRSSLDDVIDRYKRDVDRTLLRAALRLTPAERLRRLAELNRFAEDLAAAGRQQRR